MLALEPVGFRTKVPEAWNITRLTTAPGELQRLNQDMEYYATTSTFKDCFDKRNRENLA